MTWPRDLDGENDRRGRIAKRDVENDGGNGCVEWGEGLECLGGGVYGLSREKGCGDGDGGWNGGKRECADDLWRWPSFLTDERGGGGSGEEEGGEGRKQRCSCKYGVW